MYFNVSQLLKESGGSRRAFDVDEGLALTDDARASHVLGTVSMLRTDKGVWVSAALESMVLCTCSRCLVQYEQPMHLTIEEEFFPRVDIVTGARLDRSDDGDEASYIDQNNLLDMSQAVIQYATLSMPMKPVCREGCAGICLTCGVNLNETRCQCDRTPRDSRWGVLGELVSESDSDSRSRGADASTS